MLRQLLREYPDLGSFWYGHWDNVQVTPVAFLILVGVLLSLLVLLVLGGIAGYVLQSVAVCKIAKKQGAWRNIRIMACFPFVRYFAMGKVAERCDVLHAAERRRLWGRILLICCCVLVPIAAISLVVAFIGLPGAQTFVMLAEDGGSFLWNADSELLNMVMLLLYILLIAIALPALILALASNEVFLLVMVVLPFAGIVGLLLGVALVAVIRALNGMCCYKILRTCYADKVALILTVIGALTGLSSVALFAASLKKPQN